MSVAVLAVQPTYMEHYLQNALASSLSTASSSESDSDGGYGTPAEAFVKEPEVLVLSRDGERSPEPVDAELQEKIVKQVEWYFSDENLLKDSFLMKHINRNKQGYVSLKLVASLRKVKALSKDWKVVLESLKHSDLLALNEEETKICRKSPAPQVDFSHIAKTLLITNYPNQEPNLADVEQQFGRYGEVTRVRFIHPGRAIPLDVKPSKAQHPSLGKELCILVQFKSEGVAKSALKKICDQQNWRDEMKVYLLGEKKSADQEPKDQEEKSPRLNSEGRKKRKGGDSKNPEAQSSKQSQRLREYSPSPIRQVIQRRVSPPSASSSPEMYRHAKSHGAKASPELSRRYLRPDQRKDYSSDSGLSTCSSRCSSESPKLTPEPTRKFFSGSSFAELSWRSADKHHSHVNSCVIRQPLGPDGTKGFAKRVSPISIAVQSC